MSILFSIAFVTGWCIAFFNPLFSLQMEQMGASSSLIGVNSTVYFLFVGLFGVCAQRLLRASGVRNVITIGLTLGCIGAYVFAMSETVTGWFIGRAIMGAGLGFYMSAGQTAVTQWARPGHYGKTSALYALCFGLGMGLGPVFATLSYAPGTMWPLWLGLSVMVFALFLSHFGLTEKTTTHHGVASATNGTFTTPWRWIALGGAFVYGVVEAVVLTLYPIYWVQSGLDLALLGFALSLIIVGGLLSTLPAGMLADKKGTGFALQICAGSAIVAVALLSLAPSGTLALLGAFITGAAVGPIFALSIALIGEGSTNEERIASAAWFTLAFSAGSTAGPVLSAIVMEAAGNTHIFTVSGVVLTTLLLCIFSVNTTASQRAS